MQQKKADFLLPNRKKAIPLQHGKLAEWSNATVSKAVDLHGSGGSNPSLSAKKEVLGLPFSYISVLLLRIRVLLFCKLYPATIDSQKATEIEGFGGCLRAIGLHKAVINVFADCFDVDWWREVVVIEAFDSHFLALGTYI